MEVIFLGTSSMVPTKERNQTSVLVKCRNYDILLDCGEGTQRQMKIKKITPHRIKKILISHWHGDHTLGLAGLMQTLGMSDYQGVLEVYGPKGTKKHIKALHDAFHFEVRLQLKIKECKTGKIFSDDDYEIYSAELDHGVVPCIGFAIQAKDKRRINVSAAKKLGIPDGPVLGKLQQGKAVEFKGKKINPKDVTYMVKGKKLAYVTDTGLCNNAFKLAQDADLLISEATFKTDLEEKSYKAKHLTAKQAAQIASKSNVKQLIITHFSQRYKSTTEIEEDAKDYFKDVRAAFDFMKVKV
ncbi:ribonuclease Z [Candidatus Woesearchaeota archaeon]|nr:ribonuclease Z [Candidatus Woesearchaeota archaeon]MBW3014537.1 ribonuclease Z [Candidatus Woesearchaeota archaeon]